MNCCIQGRRSTKEFGRRWRTHTRVGALKCFAMKSLKSIQMHVSPNRSIFNLWQREKSDRKQFEQRETVKPNKLELKGKPSRSSEKLRLELLRSNLVLTLRLMPSFRLPTPSIVPWAKNPFKSISP